MPIYMDRHDVSETVTAENVAQLHQEDLKVQDEFGCRGITYWFDDVRKTAFCLIEAPNKEACVEMHNKAHGQVAHQVIEVDPRIVESFLGRIEDPEKAQNTVLNIINDPAFRTIMVIELHLLSLTKNDRALFQSVLQGFHRDAPKLIGDWEGRLVKQTYNHYVVSFSSVSNAVRAAFEIQKLFRENSREIDSDKVLFKIGLSTGVPVTEKNQIFEDAVKLAGRMCSVAKGEIIVSPEVKELYESENPEPLVEKESLIFLTHADVDFLTVLMDYMETVWSDVSLKVDDFSKPAGSSKSQLYRKITQITGKSPNSFIREYRLNEALNLLNKNTCNVSAIAYLTGFSSPSYFSKCFQKKYSLSPSDYLSARLG